MIQRTHKGRRIRPADHQPSLTPWVGTETVWLTADGGVAVPGYAGATETAFACVGLCVRDGRGRERDVLRLPVEDWDDLVAQVGRLRDRAGT